MLGSHMRLNRLSSGHLRRKGAHSAGSTASLLVDLPRDEIALLIELVVDLGVNRAKLQQRLQTSKPLHRPSASPNG